MISPILFYTTDGPHGFLSNFWRSPQWMPFPDRFERNSLTDSTKLFWTNEHWYQANKARHIDEFLWIANAPRPYQAMRAGRALRPVKELVDGWDGMRVEVMRTGLRAKFTQNADMRARLRATGDAPIHEDSPTDPFWGWRGPEGGHTTECVIARTATNRMVFCSDNHPGGGADMLGKLLVEIREELRNVAP